MDGSNPDVFFQSRERANSLYVDTPGIVEEEMNRFGLLTGRNYKLFEYFGDPEAERVIIMMGSGCETAEETITLCGKRRKIGYSKSGSIGLSSGPFRGGVAAHSKGNRGSDRTKETGSAGEPLYQDVVTALAEIVTPNSGRELSGTLWSGI